MALTNARKAYGEALAAFAENDKRIVCLEADLGKSTQTVIFEKRIPERFFEMGIAEANMVSFAAGTALMGKVPFLHSFAVFSTGRVYDQIRASLCIPNLHAVIIGGSSGLSDAADGSTHQSVEDIAIMRALPNMTVLCPADAFEVIQMTKTAINLDGPVYIRLCRSDMPDILDPNSRYEFGKMIPVKKDGDIAIIASGIMVSYALEAANKLSHEGINARVINCGCIKPLDTVTLGRIASEVKGIITVEEHSVIGGLGSAIAEALCSRPHPPIKIIGVQDKFGCSAYTPAELYKHYGLTSDDIVRAAKEF